MITSNKTKITECPEFWVALVFGASIAALILMAIFGPDIGPGCGWDHRGGGSDC